MGTVYLKGDDGGLVAMSAQPFDAEADLQQLLAEHPHLLLGEDPDGPGWLLIRKEAGVPGRRRARLIGGAWITCSSTPRGCRRWWR